ncbi:hypothetical protein T484DRAFT_1803210 [Baffinella frigidus]|nr:hypothetical protein T484DRAFT_1803210 [Cryptophyta sp. CCMP2293]
MGAPLGDRERAAMRRRRRCFVLTVGQYQQTLSHSGACDANSDGSKAFCVLPVNANITLRYRGVGGITDAVVSIDLYADNSSAVGAVPVPEGAVVHDEVLQPVSSMSSTFTTVRILFPSGYDVCDSVIAIQGNRSGVTLTQKDGTSKNVPFYRSDSGGVPGTTRGVGAPRVTEADLDNRRTGIDQDLFDFFVGGSDFNKRLFEMRSFALTSRTTTEAGKVERLQFVIANVRNSKTPGNLASPVERTEEVFAVRIFKTFRPANGGVVHTLRYYNNRVNDFTLNTTQLPWFSGTANKPIPLVSNLLWQAAIVFEEMITFQTTTATVTLQTFSEIPAGGSIRIQFPVGFVVSGVTDVQLVGVNYGTTRFYANLPLRSVTLVRVFDGLTVCDPAVAASISGCIIYPNLRLTVRIVGVRTLSAGDSTLVDGGFQTLSLGVQTLSAANTTLDAGTVDPLVLGPAQLTAPGSLPPSSS